MGKYNLMTEQRRRLEKVLPYIESVTEVDNGLLFTYKQSLTSPDCNRLLWNFLISGVDFSFDVASWTFLIPKKYFIEQTLQKLKTIFHTSQSEIRDCIKLLISEGVSFEEIQVETGLSRATFYRYLKRKDTH